jgi:hypothetical protein
MRPVLPFVLACALVVTWSIPSSAQSGGSATSPAAPHSWYFGVAGFGANTQTDGEDCPYVCGNLGGGSFGVVGAIGGIIGSTSGVDFRVEGEGSIDTSIETAASVRTAYYLAGAGRTFTADRRSILSSALLRIGQRRLGSGARVEAVGGFVLELARELSTNIVDTVYQGYGKPLVQVSQPDVSHFAVAPGLVGGLDVVASAARRVDFTVGARLYWFHRDSYNGSQDFPIPGPTSIRLQVGLRWLR